MDQSMTGNWLVKEINENFHVENSGKYGETQIENGEISYHSTKFHPADNSFFD